MYGRRLTMRFHRANQKHVSRHFRRDEGRSMQGLIRKGREKRLIGMSLTWKAATTCALLIGGYAVRGQDSRPFGAGPPLPGIPEAKSPITLLAVNDPVTGKSAFSSAGEETAPVIHASPGSKITLDYQNHLSSHSKEVCVDGPCMNMTNLHFHGLHVSPNAPQDDVLSMMAMPGQSLHYQVDVPAYAPPGLYWYHTHPHGESARQDLDGMSGAIVVDGIDRYYPELRKMRERVLVLRDHDLSPEKDEARSQILKEVG